MCKRTLSLSHMHAFTYCQTKSFPSAASAPAIALLQRPGDVIFVPPGWYHTVENITDAVSINHNWFNEHTVEPVRKFLQNELAAVQASLADIEFVDEAERAPHTMLLMRCNCGFDMKMWSELLSMHCPSSMLSEPGA